MATTFVQPAPGQPSGQPPVFVQPGTAPVAPGTVVYYPQAMAVATQPPNYEYTPNDFTALSLITLILCGIFSPLSLVLSIPALLCSLQSKKNAKDGAIKEARTQGIIAVYLNITAIVGALLLAIVAMGLVFGLYGETYKLSRGARPG